MAVSRGCLIGAFARVLSCGPSIWIQRCPYQQKLPGEGMVQEQELLRIYQAISESVLN